MLQDKIYRACCAALSLNDVEIAYKPTGEIVAEYKNAYYGFVLREDIVVNHVAGPTKLTEYCTYGVVPILHTPHIGDFAADGMVWLPLEDFVAGRLPDEARRRQMAEKNLLVAQKMMAQYAQSKALIQAFTKNPA